MQALYLLALEPVSEVSADPNSYGFRPMRSTADAIEQVFIACGKKASAEWVLEGDIRDALITSAMTGCCLIFPWTGWYYGNG